MKKQSLRRLMKKNRKTVDEKVKDILSECRDAAQEGRPSCFVHIDDVEFGNIKLVWHKLARNYDLWRDEPHSYECGTLRWSE